MDRSEQVCPYLDRQDSRCAGVVTLTNLRDALGRCAGDHEYCSTFHRIRRSEMRTQFVELAVARSA